MTDKYSKAGSDAGRDPEFDRWQQNQEYRRLFWQSTYTHALHADQGQIDLGVFSLKVLLTMHGGALLALLAKFSVSAASIETGDPMTSSAWWFAVGLIVAMSATAAGYFYARFHAQTKWNRFDELETGKKLTYPRAKRRADMTEPVMIALSLGSFAAFVGGIINVLCATA